MRFNQLLTECFSFHSYDNLSAFNSGCKKDPRLSHSKERDTELRNLRFAVEHGDVVAVKFRCALAHCNDTGPCSGPCLAVHTVDVYEHH